MASDFGKKVKITIFGQSHSEAIGVVIDGLPVGEEIDLDAVQKFMERRAPGRNAYSTPRKEADMPRVVSGLFEGKTCGAPICAITAPSENSTMLWTMLWRWITTSIFSTGML